MTFDNKFDFHYTYEHRFLIVTLAQVWFLVWNLYLQTCLCDSTEVSEVWNCHIFHFFWCVCACITWCTFGHCAHMCISGNGKGRRESLGDWERTIWESFVIQGIVVASFCSLCPWDFQHGINMGQFWCSNKVWNKLQVEVDVSSLE